MTVVRVFSTLVLCIGFASSSEAADFKSLLERVPAGTNSIALIDVDGILASPIARAGGWEKRFRDGSPDRPLYLPPEADRVVVTAAVDQVRGFEQLWQVALISMKEPYSMSLIARAEGGHAEQINGVNAAWVPSDAYFIEVDKQVLGLMAPANRQAIARWADRKDNAAVPKLSSYLQASASKLAAGSQAIFAIDTTDAVQPHRVREKLEGSEAAKGQDIEGLVSLISSLKGLTLQLAFTDSTTGVLQVDFASKVAMSNSTAKTLLLEGLANMGMDVPGLDTWECAVVDSSIRLSGKLDNDGLRRVFSLMELPTTKFSSLKDENTDVSTSSDVAEVSRVYFRSIESLLVDLKKRTKSNSSGDSHWVTVYANKIDKLPILHVDDDLLTYGEKLSETLRVMSGARRMSNMSGASAARAESSSAGYNGYSSDGYGYGAYNYKSTRDAERNAGNIRADSLAQGSAVKIQGWTLIDDATLEIRKEMTKRYGVEF